MKKIMLVAMLALTLTGCAFLQNQKANWQACAADPGCSAQAKQWQSNVTTAAIPVASLVPLPGAAAAPTVFGYIALGLAMLIGGNALRKKQTPPTA